LLKFLQEFT